MSTTPVPNAPILDSERAILRFAETLVGNAAERQLWVFFLNGEHKPLPPVIPIAALPVNPHQFFETDDGAVQYPVRIAEIIAFAAEQMDAESSVLVWERPGDDELSQSEIDYVLALDEQCALRGVPIVSQLLSHSDGVRTITQHELEPDEVLEAFRNAVA